MPNSDNQDGVFNKMTKEIKYYHAPTPADAVQPDTGDVVTQSFGGNVETAKAYFFHADALTNNDTNGTQLDYAITADGNGIKFTIAFGTKGTAGIAEGDDWAGLWVSTKDSLIAANKYVNIRAEQYWTAADATPHLF